MNPQPDTGQVVQPPGKPWKAVLSLALFAAIAGLVVGLSWDSTRERIADNEARQVLAELNRVLPASLYDNAPQKDVILLDTGGGKPVPVYRARRNGMPVAAVLTAIANDGYAGPIRLLVGITIDGTVLAVRVTAHTETPGIGDAIDSLKSTWISQFTGRSLGDPPGPAWSLRQDGGDFDAIAGATISSRAVMGAVARAVEYFGTHRDGIFASAPAGGGS